MTEPHTRMIDPEDPGLVAAARAGDRAALTTIFEVYREAIARWIFRMTGDGASVDDLVQEVFISAFVALPRFRGEAKVLSWLRVIAANHVRKWWDAERRRQTREGQAYARRVDPETETPDATLEAKRRQQAFYKALGSMPDSLREAFVARAIEGMDLREASETLKVPISTVSWRTRKAERILCESLELAVPQTD